MSHIPPGGPPPPPPYSSYYPGYPSHQGPPPPSYAYVPTPVMMPMTMYQPHQHPPPPPPPPQPEPVQPPQPTYVTNYIYQQPPIPADPVHVVEDPPTVTTITESRPQPLFPALRETLAKTWSEVDQCVTKILAGNDSNPPIDWGSTNPPIDWASATPATATALTHRAFVGGREGWDSSPLWIIRAHHSGEFVPGKLNIRHRAAYIPHGGKEVPVHNFEVLLAQPHMLRWLPSSHGQVPVGAIPAGNTHNGEPLYIARAKHMRSLTPGKVHPSHGCAYISFGGSEIAYKRYEVLCKIVG